MNGASINLQRTVCALPVLKKIGDVHRGSSEENSINKGKSLCSWLASYNPCSSGKARETSFGQKGGVLWLRVARGEMRRLRRSRSG